MSLLPRFEAVTISHNLDAVVRSLDPETSRVAFSTDLGGLSITVRKDQLSQFTIGGRYLVDVAHLVEYSSHDLSRRSEDFISFPVYEICKVASGKAVLYDRTPPVIKR